MRARSAARTGLQLVAALLLLAACGGTGIATRIPSPSPAVPSPTPSATPAHLSAGAPAWVDVSVASGWRAPTSPRAVDEHALRNPADIRGWLAGMTAADKVGLIDRLDTQLLLGDEVL